MNILSSISRYTCYTNSTLRLLGHQPESSSLPFCEFRGKFNSVFAATIFRFLLLIREKQGQYQLYVELNIIKCVYGICLLHKMFYLAPILLGG